MHMHACKVTCRPLYTDNYTVSENVTWKNKIRNETIKYNIGQDMLETTVGKDD